MYALLYKGKWTNAIIDLEYMHKEKGIRKLRIRFMKSEMPFTSYNDL